MGRHSRWVEEDGTVNWPENDEDEARDSLKPIPPIKKGPGSQEHIAEASLSPIETW